MKGTITNVNIGPLVIEGLLMEDGTFGVSLQQAAELFSVLPKSAQKLLKPLLGEGFQFFQVTTNRNEGTNQNRKENVIPIAEFERLLFEMALRGDARAIEMSRALIGLSLTQLFSDAFGLKFEGDDRRKYLELRMKSKGTRRSFTDEAQLYYRAKHGKDPSGPYYAALTNKVYQKLFGETAEELKTKFKVPKGKLLRDYLPEKMLHQVEASETMLCRWLDNGLSPDEAMDRL